MSAPRLKTQRLTLRALTPADAQDLSDRRSDPETAQFQGWTAPYPLERAQAFIEQLMALDWPALGEWFQFAIERNDDGVIVGDLALHLHSDGHNGEIGFTLHKWARSQGFATEAAEALLEYGFEHLGLHRFEASCDPRNTASIRVLERLGFRHEGTFIQSYWHDGTVLDDARYGLLKSEWLTLNHARPKET